MFTIFKIVLSIKAFSFLLLISSLLYPLGHQVSANSNISSSVLNSSLLIKKKRQNEQENLKTAVDDIYNFEFENLNLASLPDYQKKAVILHQLKWQYFPVVQSNDSIQELFQNQYTEVLNHAPSCLLDSAIYLNTLAEKSSYNWQVGRYSKAIPSIIKGYRIISPYLNLDLKDIDESLLLPVSLYHYYLAQSEIDNKYFSSISWILKDADKEKGLAGLERLAESDFIYQTEALFHLSLIYLRLENNVDKALFYTKKIVEKHPNNLKFYELYIEAHLSNRLLSEQVYNMIECLIKSNNEYYQKYGIIYDTLFKTMLQSYSKKEKLAMIVESKTYLNASGKSDHLLSLLLFQQNSINPNKDTLEQALSFMVYKNKLTIDR